MATRAPPVGIAQGYDTLSGEGRNTALIPTSETMHGETIIKYRVCESMEEVMEELEINQWLTVGIGAGIFSVNQKLEFVETQQLTTHSVTIVVYVKKTVGRETVTHVDLRDGVKAPESNAELREFVQVYGDSYLVSRTIGGEYFAMYTFFSETLEQKEQLTMEMEVAGIFKAFAGDAGLQRNINDFRSSQNMRMSFDQRVTGIANPRFPLPDDILDFALNDYPSSELTSPVLIHFDSYGYERVPGIGSRFNVIRQNIDRVGDLPLCKVQQLGNDIKSIIGVHDYYGGYNEDKKLLQVQMQVDADKKAVEAMKETYEADPASPLPQLLLTSLQNGTPCLQFVTRQSVGFLAPGIVRLTDDVGDVRAFLQKRTRIAEFQMTMSNTTFGDLTSLMVTYNASSSTGNNASVSWTVTHGSTVGSRFSSRLLVSPDQTMTTLVASEREFVEFLNSEGHVEGLTARRPPLEIDPIIQRGTALAHLSIELSDGRNLAYGTQNFVYSSARINTPDKHFVLGFRSDSGGRTLHIRYASFVPSRWEINT